MPETQMVAEQPDQDQVEEYDAIVIGAGISGMFMLYRLRELGMTARVFEAGTNVGGTWYWNRYPGARFDSESWTYGYSFSKELMQEWDWKEHFSPQPDTLEYLNYVADKFDLRRDMQFRSTVTAAHWDDAANQWTVTLESGQQARAQFLFTAIGILSAHTLPAIPGLDSFTGPAYHTARWPHTPVDFTGKRVGIIGTGATAIQAIPEIAKQAKQLTVFQRRPNWAAPLHNARISKAEMEEIKSRYEEIYAHCAETPSWFIHEADPRKTLERAAGGARGVLGKTVCRTGLRHLDGQFPRHPDRREGQRRDQRVHRAEDSPAREGPEGGGEADPERPRLRHPPGAAGERLFRGLQPRQRLAGRYDQ